MPLVWRGGACGLGALRVGLAFAGLAFDVCLGRRTTRPHRCRSAVVVAKSSVPAALNSLPANAPTVPVGSSQARLLTTKLINVLLLEDGRMVIGAIEPLALEAAAATAR